ncbi:thiaminase II, partial [Streptococcus sp. SPC0]|nr:thiaminase II [Streptococcus sp. SPC0]
MLKDKMIAKGAKYIQSIYQDPFIQGIIKGRLDHDVICHYLQADNIYLGKFADIYALCLAKSDNLRDKQFFLEQIDFTLNRELADGEGPHQA